MFSRLKAALVAAALLLSPALAHAQSVSLPGEFQKKIKAATDVAALGAGQFGNATSDATGKTVFENIDISLPGNSTLPVQFGRRLVIEPRYIAEELGGIGNWDIEVPYIETTVSQSYGWSVAVSGSPNRYKRCSIASPPIVEGLLFSSEEVSHGYNIHVPGVVDDMLLAEANTYTDPTDGVVYPWILKSMARLSCLPSLKNGYPGEGFVLKLTDGTKYYFDYQIERVIPALKKGPDSVPGYSMARRRVFLLATRIEDRFGNTVDYAYTNGRLTAVTANDGRQITVQYGTSTVIASANGRSWTYNLLNGHLASVTRPDGSKWHYSPFGKYTARPQYQPDLVGLEFFSPEAMCQSTQGLEEYAEAAPFTATHPSGAVGTFEFSGRYFYRSRVPYWCVIDFFDHWARQRINFHDYIQGTQLPPVEEVSGHAWIVTPNYFRAFSLDKLTVTGPGTMPQVTTYGYEEESYPYCNMYDSITGLAYGATCNEDPCADGSCDGAGRWTTITLPSGDKVRKRHGVIYGKNEGMLLAEQIVSASGALMKSVTHQYYDPALPTVQAFAKEIGVAFSPDPMQRKQIPWLSTVIQQAGDTFTSAVSTCGGATFYCFDAFARPLSVTKSSSLGYSKTETTTYLDDTTQWVLGLPLTSSVNGTEVSKTEYNAQRLPWKTYTFGKLQSTLTYHANGTLATVMDGRSHVTTFSNWKRGIPQSILHPPTDEAPTGATESAVVDDNGWITSTTDENNYTSGYAYDTMGRLAGMAYPTVDSVVWLPKAFEFRALTASDWLPPGISVGQWRHYEGQGNYAKFTYFDAQWRPVLVHEYDASNVGSTLRSTRTTYDSNGRQNFQSYPVSDLIPGNSGSRTFYDALDRVTRVEQDSEHGVLATNTEYLPGLQVRVTNPRNQQTVTGFMAWGQPGYDLPLWSSQPEGKVIEIARHPRFGWPLQLKQRSADNSLQQVRSYVYDDHAQLCKTIEPETGATVTGYDAANNPEWSASGLIGGSYTSTTDCSYTAAGASGRVVTRSYDARNRLKTLLFPDGIGNQVWTYEKDGLPKDITTFNGPGNTTPVVNGYYYNKRRLLTSEYSHQPGWYTWGIGYDYDPIGNLRWQSYPTGLTLDYAPNALGQATQARDQNNKAYASGAQYFPNGAMKQFTYGNGIVHTMTQNARQLPSRVTSSAGVLDYTYFYDANGNPEHIANELVSGYDVRDRWMSYDGLDRLTAAGSASFGGDHWHRFTYDALDNLKSWKLAGVKDYADYIYDSQHRLTSIRNTAGATVMGLEYDPQGNLRNKNGQIYEFDYGNRLRGVTNKEYYRYDGLGRRVLNWHYPTASTPNGTVSLFQYSQSGQLMYEEHSERPNGVHVYLAGSLIATRHGDGSVKYQHTDALGSPVAVTNEAGAVVERNDYEPYGAIIGKPNYSGIGYTGHVMDGATGLTYMQQRYYDQSIGRFLSVDPVTADSGTGANFNRYKYAANNPYRFVDPDGRQEAIADVMSYADPVQREAEYIAAKQSLPFTADFLPIISDVKAGIEAYKDPTPLNVSVAGIGLFPGLGDVAAKAMKEWRVVSNALRKIPTPTLKESPFGAKIADAIPKKGVPSNWSREQIGDAIVDYKTSIASRKAELAAFDASGRGSATQRLAHARRITEELTFLKSLEKAGRNRK